MSENQEVWSEKKLPKNIRQIGETDGQNRVYMEDYVYTYIRKALEKRSSQVVCGVLIGTWETKSTGRCYFIKSAMVMEGLLSAKESMVAGTPLWKKTRELSEYYFPGQDLIGWFLHSREEGFFDQTEMTCMHRNLYPEGRRCPDFIWNGRWTGGFGRFLHILRKKSGYAKLYAGNRTDDL